MNKNIFGLGNVGSGFYNIIIKKSKKIITFSKKNRFNCKIFNNFNDYKFLFKKKSLFIELIGGVNICIEIFLNCIKNNNNIITANKEIISKYYFFLNFIFNIFNKKIFFEASVCGSIPIINLLKNFYFFDKKIYFIGILNGTNNFILNNIKKKNFLNLIKFSINKGFAENNYSNDLLGIDTLYKSSVIFSILNYNFLNFLKFNLISIFGINYFLKNILYNFVYLNTIFFFKKYIILNISLFLTKNVFFLKSKNSLNSFFFNCFNSKKSFYTSPGAGSLETSISVLSDYYLSFKKKIFLKKKCFSLKNILNFNFNCNNFFLIIKKKINNIFFLYKNKINIIKYYIYKNKIILKSKKNFLKKILEFLFFLKNEKFQILNFL